jgi:coenzyme F420-reducing hydrogenase alpha subunit
MSKRKITINPIIRLEGHGKIEKIKIKEMEGVNNGLEALAKSTKIAKGGG